MEDTDPILKVSVAAFLADYAVARCRVTAALAEGDAAVATQALDQVERITQQFLGALATRPPPRHG